MSDHMLSMRFPLKDFHFHKRILILQLDLSPSAQLYFCFWLCRYMYEVLTLTGHEKL